MVSLVFTHLCVSHLRRGLVQWVSQLVAGEGVDDTDPQCIPQPNPWLGSEQRAGF